MTETLRRAQRFGFLGSRPIPEAIAHARRFVDALADVRGSVVDLGSGGGLPGLVLAVDRPDLSIALVDRRQKRTDFLEQATARLGVGDRVSVHCGDARQFATEHADSFDAVTARGFGPPEMTLRIAAQCRSSGGLIVISEPPSGDRWDDDLVISLGLTRRPAPGVMVFFAR